ncbi:MAG: Ig-like domain-containing protein [Oscillospiraceae bacterium]|nr:Ig-like domain-containing protein [Oscillospiraceae bacterium]
MKKIMAMILAVTMLLSVGSFAVFAAGGDPVTLTLEVAGEPSTSGAVANPTKADDIFEVTLKATDFTATTVKGLNQVRITWDPAVIVPVTTRGANAAATSGYVHTLPREAENEDGEIEGIFSYQPVINIEEGWYDITQYIAPSNENSAKSGGSGYAIPAGAAEVELWRIRFKVLKEGDTKLAISEEALYAPAIRFDDFDVKSVVTVKPAAISIPYGSTPPVVQDKEITAITAPTFEAVEVGAAAPALPATVNATVEGEEATLALTVTWDGAFDTTEAGTKTVTGTVTVPAGYKLADGVSATVTATLEVKAKEEEPPVEDPEEPIEIVSVVAPEIEVYVGTASDDVKAQLGETVVGLTADGEEVAVNVAWSGTVDTKKVATKSVKGTLTAPEGYVLAKKLTTVTATVHVVKVPADTTIDSVEAIAPITVFVGDEIALPAAVVGYVTEDKTVDVAIEWPEVDTSVAGTYEIAGKLVAPAGYDLAEGLTEVKVIITVIALADLPVELGEARVNEADGNIVIPFSVKPEYAGYEVGGKGLDDYSEMVISLTYMNGITPVKVTGLAYPKPASGWGDLEGEFKFTETIPENANAIQYCVVVGYNVDEPVSITNLGIPVGAAKPYTISK